MVWHSISRRNWKELIGMGQIFLIWLVSFLILYKVSLTHMVHGKSLKNTWGGAFGPTPVFLFATLIWVKDVFLEMFKNQNVDAE